LSESVIDLAAAHLKRQFLYQTQRGRFGNRDAVLELAISARGCAASAASQPRIMLAFVLERVLDQWAKHLSGRPISLSETAHLSGRLQQPIARAGVAVTHDLVAAGTENALVVGAALPGAVPWREGSGEGIALSSGYRAAQVALAKSGAQAALT